MSAPSYTYKTTEISTGKVLLDGPVSQCRYARSLGGGGRSAAGRFQCSIPLVDSRVQNFTDWKNATEPNSVELVIERNGVVVYTGLVTGPREYDSRTQTITLNGRESWAYFDRRLIEWNNATGSNPPGLYYIAKDQGLILLDLLVRAAGSPQGDFRIDLPDPFDLPNIVWLTTGVVRDRTYLYSDTRVISTALEELASVQNGFEFYLNGYWSTNNILRHRLVFGYPNLGADTPEALHFERPGGLTSYTWADGGPGQVNEIFALGDDGSGGTRVDRAKLLPGRQLLMQQSLAFRDVDIIGTLHAHAAGEVARRIVLGADARVRVTGIGPPAFGTYNLGDTATFLFNDPFFSNSAQLMRIVGWEVTCPDVSGPELIDLVLAVP